MPKKVQLYFMRPETVIAALFQGDFPNVELATKDNFSMTKSFQQAIAVGLAISVAMGLTIGFPKRSTAQAEAAVLTGCLSNPACIALMVVIGGYVYWSVSEGDRIVTGEYLEDPEAPEPEIWTDYIWADNPAQAEQRCKAYAQNAGVRYIGRIQVGARRYECFFEG